MIDVDIPQLSSNGIHFDSCFQYTITIQSSSKHSHIPSSFDATALSAYIMNKSQYVPFELSKLTNSSNTMIIPNGYFNGNSIATFNISNIGVLKSIVIGDNCFGKVRVFELDGLSELESVVIGQKSFRIGSSERSDGSCRIVNCPKLKSIQIGYRSLEDYQSIELNNLPSLQSIDMGEQSFYWTPLFSLTGLIDGLV